MKAAPARVCERAGVAVDDRVELAKRGFGRASAFVPRPAWVSLFQWRRSGRRRVCSSAPPPADPSSLASAPGRLLNWRDEQVVGPCGWVPAGARARNFSAVGQAASVRGVEGASASLSGRAIRIGDIDLRVLDQGEGAPVVLLHGFPDRAEEWRRVGARLRPSAVDEQSCRTYAGSARARRPTRSRRLPHQSHPRRSQRTTRRARGIRSR